MYAPIACLIKKTTSGFKYSCLPLLFFFLFFPYVLFSQQLSDFTQYRDLQTSINPAAIPIDYFVYDSDYTLFLGAVFRDQWTDREGEINTPTTKMLTIDFIPKDIEEGGLLVGGYILQDRSGIFETTGVYGKIAGVLNVGIGEISLGLNIGLVQHRLKFRTGEGIIGIAGTIQDDFSGVFSDVGCGIFYRQDLNNGFFYTGISIPQVFGFQNDFSIRMPLVAPVKRVRHYYYTFGLLYNYLEDSSVEPSIFIKYVPDAPTSVKINIRAQLSNHFWLGTGFSLRGAFHFNAGILLRNEEDFLIKFGVGYSVITKDYGNEFGSSQEYYLNGAF